MASLRLVAGLILLILGRQLFWVFVFVLGFVMGMDLAAQLIPDSSQLTVLVVALLAGILGAGLAYFFYHVAIAVAGFLAGGRIGVELVGALMPSSPQATWLAFIAGGVVGAILLLLIFDWALIVISSLLGASFIIQQIPHQPSMNGILLTVLVIGGIAVQAQMMRRGSRAA
jgi:Domain of unknown function (DUF4203)